MWARLRHLYPLTCTLIPGFTLETEIARPKSINLNVSGWFFYKRTWRCLALSPHGHQLCGEPPRRPIAVATKNIKKKRFKILFSMCCSRLETSTLKCICLGPKMYFFLDVLHTLWFRDLQGHLFFGLEILTPGHFPKIAFSNYIEQRVAGSRTAPFWMCTSVEEMGNSESTYVILYEGQSFSATWINTSGTSKPGVCTTKQGQYTQGSF